MRWINIFIMIFVISSCKKNTGDGTQITQPPSPAAEREKRIAALTKEVAEVMEQVYESSAACHEVNAAILSGYYADERVLLKDLLNPAESELYRQEEFKKLKPDTGAFRKRFCEIVVRGTYPLLRAALAPAPWIKPDQRDQWVASSSQLTDEDVGVLAGSGLVSIYFPYAENFPSLRTADSLPKDNKIAIMLRPTIVFTDRDADAAPGRDPYYCPGTPGKLCYRDVMVDDNYAELRPTHIIGIGARRADAASIVPKTELVHRVYHGSSRLKKQMDRLVSLTGNGGGSEIKVCRINGYLRRSDEQIDDFAGDVVTLQYTRADIRKKRWKRVFSVWDPNWNYQDIEQIYAVYEDDNKGSRTIDGSLKTTLTLPAKLGKAEGDIGFKIQVVTQDEIITQRKLDRKSYLRDGLNNQGWGFLPDASDFLSANTDWPVLDGGSIWEYTMPYRIY